MAKEADLKIEISDVMRKALDDLERAEFECSVQEAHVKGFKGKATLHFRPSNGTKQ